MTPISPQYFESPQWNRRTRSLLGEEVCERLAESRVLVVGLGGVGGYATEMLARTGIGNLTLIDADNVEITNLNRQIIATVETIGAPKSMLFAERIHAINAEATITSKTEFLTPDNVEEILAPGFDYVVDAIDTVSPKVALITECFRRKLPVISSMGAGGRLDVTKVGYFDLWQTREDGLARAVRQKLKRIGFRPPLKVVASTEKPVAMIEDVRQNKLTSFGTTAAVPALFGIYLAQYVIRKLSGK